MVAVSGSSGTTSTAVTGSARSSGSGRIDPHTRRSFTSYRAGTWPTARREVRDPIGMTAVRLEVETHIVTASSTSVQKPHEVRPAGRPSRSTSSCWRPLPRPRATLTDEDRELGVCLADNRRRHPDIAISRTARSPLRDDPDGWPERHRGPSESSLRVTPTWPRAFKFRYGSAMPMDVDPDEVLQVTSIGEETSHGVTRRAHRRDRSNRG